MFDYPLIMTRKQVQDILHTSKANVLKLINNGELQAFKCGNGYRVTRDDLKEYVQNAYINY